MVKSMIATANKTSEAANQDFAIHRGKTRHCRRPQPVLAIPIYPGGTHGSIHGKLSSESGRPPE